jgi:septum site-determining protein MinD
MVKIINICSGKGGVGKTSVVANLGAALQSLGKRVVIVDCNLTTSHLGLLFGFYAPQKTLNNFLRKEAGLEDVTYVHNSGLKLVPASLDIGDLANIETDSLKDALKASFHDYDFVLLDSAPGIGKEALIPLKACDETIFVANPYVPSTVDIMKIKNLSDRLGINVNGIIINRVRKKKYELSAEEICRFTDLPVICMIPEDESLLKSVNSRNISFFSHPSSKSSRAFSELARRVAGVPYCNKSSFWRR